MTHQPAKARKSFLLPPGTTAAGLERLLDDGIRLRAGDADRQRLWYLDSFDWRLYQGGAMLTCEQLDNGYRLQLCEFDGSWRCHPENTGSMPAWPNDLTDGTLRQCLAKLLEMRVLLPLVEIDVRVKSYRVLNEDDKTTAWLRFEQPQCHAPRRREPRVLLPRVALEPLRGYDAETDVVAERLRDNLELPAAPAMLFDEALAAVGRQAGDYSSKIDVRLSPEMPALEAAGHIFKQLNDTLQANIDGTRKDLDSEFLHDLRVATRRTRSALSQIKGILPPDLLEDFKERFAWLGKVTGPTRDLDVFLLTYPNYLAQLPKPLRPALEPLRLFLVAHRKTEQAALKRKLGSAHFRKLLHDWQSLLNDLPAPDPTLQPNAIRSAKDVADERIWRMFRRVVKEGRAIDETSCNADLHELRKSCKKLRYLIEFFQSLYGSDSKPLVAALKRLLDNLGEFQDLEVQAGKLTGFAENMQQEGNLPLSTLLAMGGLITELLRGQDAVRAEFASRFAEFDSKSNRAAYRRLFKSIKA